MIQKVDLNENKNLFVVCVILIAGVGGLNLKFGDVILTEVAVALILGILVNLLVNIKGKKKNGDEQLVMEEVAESVALDVQPVETEENASAEASEARTEE